MWYPWHGLQQSIGRYVFASQFVKDRAVLEIGCENGYGASYLKSKGAGEVIGGDILKEAIEYAKGHYEEERLHFLLLDAQQLPFPYGSFDVIVAFELIEHLEKYADFLDECKRVLKDGGIFLCSTPNKEISSANRDKPWFPGHVKEFGVEELRDVLASYFDEVVIYGLCPAAKGRSMIDRVIYSPKPKVFQFLKPAGVKAMNLVTNFIFRQYRFVSLEEMNEKELDKIANREYEPFLLQGDSLSPFDVIVVARRRK